MSKPKMVTLISTYILKIYKITFKDQESRLHSFMKCQRVAIYMHWRCREVQKWVCPLIFIQVKSAQY